MAAILPGATIGILGGGQLGRMAALAARGMGYGVAVLDPDPACAAGAVADRVITAAFDDAAAAAELARASSVVTWEIERVGAAAAAAVAAVAPLRPGVECLTLVQDRERQKAWLEANGFPVGPWRAADGATAIAHALSSLGGPCRAKAVRGGYDGRAQARVLSPDGAAEAHTTLGGAPAVVERELSLAAELSVLVARRPSGDDVVFPPARNWHNEGILTFSQLPGDLPGDLASAAVDLAERIARALRVEGLLAVEMFLTTDGALLVNELSPRPHNTFHTTEMACATSQFEQLVRAVCDLPLGAVDVVRPSALANLLGDLWSHGTPPLERPLALPGVRLALYGKAPRPGRKVGHLLAGAATPAEALALVRRARSLLDGK